MSRLADQIKQVLPVFAALETPPALIGGLALAAHRVVRATSDVDFLVAAADADRVHELLLSLGYHCIHRSEDAANYARNDEGFDLLYAHRPIAQQQRTPNKKGHSRGDIGHARIRIFLQVIGHFFENRDQSAVSIDAPKHV